jgi:hypothetical protein
MTEFMQAHKQQIDWIIENWQVIAALVAGGGALGGVLWALVMKFVPDLVVNSFMDRIDMALSGKTKNEKGEVVDISDPDDRQLVVRVMSALVEWAEKKIPDEGLGEQKMRLVLDKIYSTARLVPVVGSRVEAKLRSKEPRIIEFINAVVTKMNKRLEGDTKKA